MSTIRHSPPPRSAPPPAAAPPRFFMYIPDEAVEDELDQWLAENDGEFTTRLEPEHRIRTTTPQLGSRVWTALQAGIMIISVECVDQAAATKFQLRWPELARPA